jgi:hypothetical protein
MSRWTTEEDDLLKQLAVDGMSATLMTRALAGRSEAAITGRACRLGVPLASRAHQSLIDHLREGGAIIREQVGGAIGVHWTTAARAGGHFSDRLCERLLSLGYIAPLPGRENVFGWLRG